jgi:uncharacterized coiled-coil protein SlyX
VARRSAKNDPASSVEDVVDNLYSLDPDEFTGARNEATKRLRAEGDKAGSDLVKGLRKPTAAAWAVNQLSRRVPKRVDELLRAGGSLRSAQRAALSGSGKALREATQRRRAAVAGLLDEASAVFRDAGRNPAPHIDAVRSSLEAASTDEATGDLVRSGRLTKEVEPPTGFGDVSPFEVLAGGRASPAADAEEAPEASPAERRLRERLEARVAKAEDALTAAREAAAEARREADQAAKDVDRLERELGTARRRADRAAKSATAAEARANEAEDALESAQSDLKAEL